jgi:hypothetical protein
MADYKQTREISNLNDAVVDILSGVGSDAKSCLLKRRLLAFAAKDTGAFWKSGDAFIKAAKKEPKFKNLFTKAGEIETDWSDIFAQIGAIIDAIIASKTA